MPPGDAYRQLADALDEIEFWRNLAPLLPFAVHHDHRAERIKSRIPRQRAPSEPLRRAVPTGTPATPNTQWGTRSKR
jgi:hypothetical protein